jgi:hypothetical protein
MLNQSKNKSLTSDNCDKDKGREKQDPTHAAFFDLRQVWKAADAFGGLYYITL